MKRLVIRLSSLGDVVLAASILEVMPEDGTTDWLTASEYGVLLKGHPKINQTILFDRRTGFKGWVELSRQLWNSNYDEIYDLHHSLRSRLLRMLFSYWELKQGKAGPRFKSISKQRVRLYGYFLFKKLWPKKFLPTPWVKRYTAMVTPEGAHKGPDFSHLLAFSQFPPELDQAFEKSLKEGARRYLCVMPSSRWPGKNWPTESYVAVLKNLSYFPVILGSKGDTASVRLCENLRESGIPHFSGVGKWDLLETSWVLKRSVGYLGGDTGLAHLAEALGVRAHVLYGPTTPEMGFRPWRKESVAVSGDLWCKPCGKDGRFCYRVWNRYQCQEVLTPDHVYRAISK